MALSLLLRSVRTNGLGSWGPSSLVATRIFGEQIYAEQKDQGLFNYVQNRGAARKGKRIERARLARLNASKRRLLQAQNPKLKKDQKRSVKVDKSQFKFLTERQLDRTAPPPPEDNVYFLDKYRRKRFDFEEIIEFHRQAVHPDVLNLPDSPVTATIELNLKMKVKKKKYIERIESTVCYPHYFQYEIKPRKIVALCSKEEDQEAARQAGAIQAGAADIVQLLKSNQLTHRDFDHIVCHNDFLVNFSNVKGMKGSPFFPTKQRNNFGDNIVELVKYFKNGIDYSLKRAQDEQSYGLIACHFGLLNMTTEQLRENLVTLFQSVNRFKPVNMADGKQFFEKVTITTPVTEEMFFLKFWDLIDDYEDPDILERLQEEKRAAAEAN